MFSKNRKGDGKSMEMNVMLDEPLTSDSCTKLVMEFIQYILYVKRQISMPYEALNRFHSSSITTANRNIVNFRTLSSALKDISDNLSSQFFRKNCDIKEIAIILGATILSPKLYIVIELPSYVLNSKRHKEFQHPHRKPLLKLMRSILACVEFQEAMNVPLGMTNMFVMLRKSDSNSESDFFLPKPQYVPSVQTASCFKIKLCQPDQEDVQCVCMRLIKVYQDLCPCLENEDHVQYTQYNSSTQSSYLWYQSKQIIKGFKFYP